MDSNERHNERDEAVNSDLIADSLTANGRNRHREHTRKTNKLWLWLGVLILVAILLYWLFSIGMFESLAGVTNG